MTSGDKQAPPVSRRAFLASAGAIATAGIGLSTLQGDRRLILAGGEDRAGRFHVLGLSGENRPVLSLPVSQRLHGAAQNPVEPSRVVLIARRPGNLAYELDLDERRIRRTIRSAPGRHFYGHGEYTADGTCLLTTENAYETGLGKIVVRDAADFRIIEELGSGGVGPHDLRLLSDSTTLVVANGGIRTHPVKHRQKLNLETMVSSLAYIDLTSGQVIGDFRVPNPALSIRHLRVASNDDVLIAMQYEGDPGDVVPLVAIHDGVSEIAPFETPRGVAQKMLGYSSEAAFNADEDIVYLALPRAGLLARYERATGSFIDTVSLAQVTSLAADTTDRRAGILVASKTLGVGRPREQSEWPPIADYRLDDHVILAI